LDLVSDEVTDDTDIIETEEKSPDENPEDKSEQQ